MTRSEAGKLGWLRLVERHFNGDEQAAKQHVASMAPKGFEALVQKRFGGDRDKAKRWLGLTGRWVYFRDMRPAFAMELKQQADVLINFNSVMMEV